MPRGERVKDGRFSAGVEEGKAELERILALI